MNINNLFGIDFLRFIEDEKGKGKTLEEIATEHNKTKEAIRSKIKREKKKVDINTIKGAAKSTSCIANKIIKKDAEEKVNSNNNSSIENKLDFIISLLKKECENNSRVQIVRQEVQFGVQQKKVYTKTSIRIEEEIWERFKKFCKEHDKFKQQDLLSLAINEFIEKYK